MPCITLSWGSLYKAPSFCGWDRVECEYGPADVICPYGPGSCQEIVRDIIVCYPKELEEAIRRAVWENDYRIENEFPELNDPREVYNKLYWWLQ